MSENDELGDFEDHGDSPDSDEDPTEQEEYRGQTYAVDEDETEFPEGTVEIRGNNLDVTDPETWDEVVTHGDVDGPEDALEQARDLLDVQGDLNEVETRLSEVEGEVDDLRPLDEANPLSLDPRVGVKDLAFDRAKPGAKVYVVDVLAESVPDYYEAFPDAPALDDYAGNVVTRFRDADAVFAVVYVKDSLTSVDTNITAYPMPESRLTRYPAEEASMVGSSSVEFLRTNVPGEANTGKVRVLSTLLSQLWGQNPQAAVEDLSLEKFRELLVEVVGSNMADAAIENAGYEEEV